MRFDTRYKSVPWFTAMYPIVVRGLPMTFSMLHRTSDEGYRLLTIGSVLFNGVYPVLGRPALYLARRMSVTDVTRAKPSVGPRQMMCSPFTELLYM